MCSRQRDKTQTYCIIHLYFFSLLPGRTICFIKGHPGHIPSAFPRLRLCGQSQYGLPPRFFPSWRQDRGQGWSSLRFWPPWPRSSGWGSRGLEERMQEVGRGLTEGHFLREGMGLGLGAGGTGSCSLWGPAMVFHFPFCQTGGRDTNWRFQVGQPGSNTPAVRGGARASWFIVKKLNGKEGASSQAWGGERKPGK